MKIATLILVPSALLSLAPVAGAAAILSQNFDTDPVNYTLPGISDPFRIDTIDPARYWAPSNFPGIAVNPGVTGAAGTYLAVQNINNDGDGLTLTFDTAGPNGPAEIDFTVNVTDFSDIILSVALAGMPNVEVENYVRAFTDNDGDGFYETQLFNFLGSSNSAYTDALLGALTQNFATFTIALSEPTALDGNLRLRFELFNDTQSQNEASGIDEILISGTPRIPEPSAAVLGLATLGLCFRRRR